MGVKISGEALYSIYVLEDSVVSGRERKKKNKRIPKEKFVTIAKKTKSDNVLGTGVSREDARKTMINNVYGSTGFIEYFIFRAIIMWIIDKILDYYFN